MKFQVDSFSSLEDVAWTNIQNEIIKRQLLKMCTALLHNLFCPCMKFQVDYSHRLVDLAQTNI